ncbi:MAG: hypothetical protein CMQ75_02000 [Gammaproteobacteria bacterium]|nr:hypothetical protein [Gammaproteobacteria bacterium]
MIEKRFRKYLSEGYEGKIIAVCKEAGIDCSFKDGKLYVDKGDVASAKKAIKADDDIIKLPEIIGESKINEDSVDMEKHNTLNDIFQALEQLNTEVDELDALDSDMDSTGVGDLNDQLTTFRKHISALYQVLDRAGRIVPMESVNEAVDQALIDQVVDQIIRDIEMGDQTAIEELLMSCPEDKLKGFLSELEENKMNELDRIKQLSGIYEAYKLDERPSDRSRRGTRPPDAIGPGTTTPPKVGEPVPQPTPPKENPRFDPFGGAPGDEGEGDPMGGMGEPAPKPEPKPIPPSDPMGGMGEPAPAPDPVGTKPPDAIGPITTTPDVKPKAPVAPKADKKPEAPKVTKQMRADAQRYADEVGLPMDQIGSLVGGTVGGIATTLEVDKFGTVTDMKTGDIIGGDDAEAARKKAGIKSESLRRIEQLAGIYEEYKLDERPSDFAKDRKMQNPNIAGADEIDAGLQAILKAPKMNPDIDGADEINIGADPIGTRPPDAIGPITTPKPKTGTRPPDAIGPITTTPPDMPELDIGIPDPDIDGADEIDAGMPEPKDPNIDGADEIDAGMPEPKDPNIDGADEIDAGAGTDEPKVDDLAVDAFGRNIQSRKERDALFQKYGFAIPRAELEAQQKRERERAERRNAAIAAGESVDLSRTKKLAGL